MVRVRYVVIFAKRLNEHRLTYNDAAPVRLLYRIALKAVDVSLNFLSLLYFVLDVIIVGYL